MAGPQQQPFAGRRQFLIGMMLMGGVVLLARAVDLHVLDSAFLQGQGEARHHRTLTVSAHRGMITDRNGEPLAVSSPVDSVWGNPQAMTAMRPEQWQTLAARLGTEPARLRERVLARKEGQFVYLRRHLPPEMAAEIQALELPGIGLQREYRRFYPTGEVAGHLLGFTNIDDRGQEGIERAYDRHLSGQNGRKRVLKDRLGRVIRDLESLAEPRPGQDLALSIDRRIQYLAYRELKSAVKQHQAQAGSAVVVDAGTGQVLAMVNQPAFNPNNRAHLAGDRYRNRAATDTFEPGSTLKPFAVGAALDAGVVHPESEIDTAPGFYSVTGSPIRDIRDFGTLDVAGVLQKSSNVGAAKIALDLPAEGLWATYRAVGFGERTNLGIPGEGAGTLRHHQQWRKVDRATAAFGYGVSTTLLQLARAYTLFANDGRIRELTLRPDRKAPLGDRVFGAQTARTVAGMLEGVVARDGTGHLAAVPGYPVAAKTGTVRKLGPEGYAEDRYQAVFAGMAPTSGRPLIMVVMIDEPGGEAYYSGQVAAPVFSRVMEGALRLLDIPPETGTGSGAVVETRADPGGGGAT